MIVVAVAVAVAVVVVVVVVVANYVLVTTMILTILLL